MKAPSKIIRTHLIVVAALAGLTSGCADNLHHRDAVTTHAGDAQAANIALQMIDPWPVEASITDFESDGQRGVKAIENYRKGADSGDTTAGAVGITLIPSTGGGAE